MTSEPWRATGITGVMQRRLSTIGDERGSFTELWRASGTGDVDAPTFVQANLSRSRAGVLRGMHFHRRQLDLWVLIEGRALAASTDLRGLFAGEPESVSSQVIEMTVGDVLLIPRMVAHGFWALEDMALLYLVSNEYDGTDEYGFAWDDSAAAIEWPPGEPILSDRDRNNPTLGDLATKLRQQSPGR